MTREEDLVYDISEILQDVGERLSREPQKTIVLKLMQERVSDLARDLDSRDLLLLDYFLKSFVERLWFNLMIDFPYEVGEETSRIRREVLDSLIQKVGNGLVKLADSLRGKDYCGCYEAYRDLASAYVAKTRELEARRR